MSGNANDPLFAIRLTGGGVRPHLVPASDLAQLSIAAEQAVLAIAARENPEAAERGWRGQPVACCRFRLDATCKRRTPSDRRSTRGAQRLIDVLSAGLGFVHGVRRA